MVSINEANKSLYSGINVNNATNKKVETSNKSISNEKDIQVSKSESLSIPKQASGKAISSLSFNDNPNNFIEYKVKKGDTLNEIAKAYLGNSSKYMEIYEANREQMKNPNDLSVGMILKIPSNDDNLKDVKVHAKSTKARTPEKFNEVKVHKGESLSTLSLKYLGNSERYMEIYEANKNTINSPELLKNGSKINVPVYPTKPKNIINNITTNSVEAPKNSLNEMNEIAKELYTALKGYENIKATDKEMVEIAIEVANASKVFGVSPKLMLATYAHESGGFNPRAKSHTGAGGLGQLTGVAIRQVHYMAGMAKGQKGSKPFTEYKENFIKNQTNISERFNIKKNIWTSTAYMSYEINERANGNIKKALKRYGDPNVSTYNNKVAKEYKELFGKNLF